MDKLARYFSNCNISINKIAKLTLMMLMIVSLPALILSNTTIKHDEEKRNSNERSIDRWQQTKIYVEEAINANRLIQAEQMIDDFEINDSPYKSRNRFLYLERIKLASKYFENRDYHQAIRIYNSADPPPQVCGNGYVEDLIEKNNLLALAYQANWNYIESFKIHMKNLPLLLFDGWLFTALYGPLRASGLIFQFIIYIPLLIVRRISKR